LAYLIKDKEITKQAVRKRRIFAKDQDKVWKTIEKTSVLLKVKALNHEVYD